MSKKSFSHIKNLNEFLSKKKDSLITFLKEIYNKYKNNSSILFTFQISDDFYNINFYLFDFNRCHIDTDIELVDCDEVSEILFSEDSDLEINYKEVNKIIFSWFSICWQEANLAFITIPSILEFHDRGEPYFDLLEMNPIYDKDKWNINRKISNTGILTKKEIEERIDYYLNIN